MLTVPKLMFVFTSISLPFSSFKPNEGDEQID